MKVHNEQILLEPYNRTTVLAWLLPCRPNGKILKFIVKCERLNFDDFLLYEVLVIDNREEYFFSTDEFLPDSYYKITVTAVTENHTGEEMWRVIEIESGGMYLGGNTKQLIYL